jgi:hypothetical protein
LPDRAKQAVAQDWVLRPDAFAGKLGVRFGTPDVSFLEMTPNAKPRETRLYAQLLPDDLREPPQGPNWASHGDVPPRFHEDAWSVSADGTRIARQDPAYAGRMDVFNDAGQPVATVRLAPASAPIVWSGLVGNDLLLALSGGTLTCCDLAQRTVRWRWAGDYRPGIVRGESGIAALPTAGAGGLERFSK